MSPTTVTVRPNAPRQPRTAAPDPTAAAPEPTPPRRERDRFEAPASRAAVRPPYPAAKAGVVQATREQFARLLALDPRLGEIMRYEHLAATIHRETGGSWVVDPAGPGSRAGMIGQTQLHLRSLRENLRQMHAHETGGSTRISGSTGYWAHRLGHARSSHDELVRQLGGPEIWKLSDRELDERIRRRLTSDPKVNTTAFVFMAQCYRSAYLANGRSRRLAETNFARLDVDQRFKLLSMYHHVGPRVLNARTLGAAFYGPPEQIRYPHQPGSTDAGGLLRSIAWWSEVYRRLTPATP